MTVTANVCKNQDEMITTPVAGTFSIPGASSSYFIDILQDQEQEFLYFMGFYYFGSVPFHTVIYKSDYDLTKVKIMTYNIYCQYFSFTIDLSGGFLYVLDRSSGKIFEIRADTLGVVRGLSISGATVHTSSQMAWKNNFFFSLQLSGVMETCRWDMTTSNLDCFNFGVNAFTNLAPISSDILFFGSIDFANNKYYLVSYNFSATPRLTWKKNVSCQTSGCASQNGKSLISQDGQLIYTMVQLKGNFLLYFLRVQDGASVSSGFIWSNPGGGVYSMNEFDKFVTAQLYTSTYTPNFTRLMLFKKDGSMVIKEYRTMTCSSYAAFRYQSGEQEIMYFPGMYRTNYTFFLGRASTDRIDSLSEFQIDTFRFVPITTSYTISTATTGPSLISTPRTLSITTPGPVTSTDRTTSVTPSFTASVALWNEDYVRSVLSNSLVELDFIWACTHTVDPTVVGFSLAQSGGNSIPDWVKIDVNSQELYLNKTPKLSVSQTYYFSLQISYNSETRFKRFEITVEGCSIANCEMCQLGNQTICEDCAKGYQTSNGNKSCSEIQTEPGDEIEIKVSLIPENAAVASAMVASSASIASVSSILSGSSISSMFSVMNSLQLAILLPLIPHHFPIDVIAFLKGMSFTLLSFDFVKLEDIQFVEEITEWIDYPQSNEYLGSIGINSGSSFMNYLSFLGFICFIGICHCCIILCRRCTIKTKKKKWAKLMKDLFEFFTFNIYIRAFIQAFLFTILSIFSEMYALNLNTSASRISLAFCGVYAICTSVPFLLSFYLYKYSFSPIKDDKFWLCKEYFSGVKEGRYSKLYSSLFLLLRLLSVFLLIFGNSLPSSCKATGFLLLNGGYGAYLLIVRPFVNLQDNIIETINQILFCCLIVPLIWIDTESDWSAFYESYFTQILMITPMIGGLICLIFLLKSIITFTRSLCNLSTAPKPPSQTPPPPTTPSATPSPTPAPAPTEEHKSPHPHSPTPSQPSLTLNSSSNTAQSNACILKVPTTPPRSSSPFMKKVLNPQRILDRFYKP
ncbi:unnamed protein product [Moneuplotes crassus]|uniref:Transmembrane protein n=1 Tax=Euplotes crassus TaxID=5936 RepID=A0AAD1XWJ9_EUPCR|nr:unnamed protein product [Moneuplotes crassus]